VSNSHATPEWEQTVSKLHAIILGIAVIVSLYWAQVIFIPLALAIFLSFILNPLVRTVQRTGLPRVPSVVLVVFLAALVLAGIGWLVTRQTTGLINELPNYTDNIRNKIRSAKAIATRSERMERFIQVVSGELLPGEDAPSTGDMEGELNAEEEEKPTPVVVRPDVPQWLGQLPGYLGTIAQTAGVVALALILVIFMLINREDLRNRFLRLVSHGRLSSTTKAVDEAGQRVSRYLFMQAFINTSYGATLAAGLFIIGVKYALLWGLFAAILRYIPYLGPWLAAIFPLTLSIAISEGWWVPLAVIGLILTLELLSNNVMEPWLYGQSMGVSAVAQVVSAAFWAFLWGPIGLVLSAPMTVVLLVLGKHVKQLEILDVLLGDEPVLEPDITFYQRLLARDRDEAKHLALRRLESSTLEEVADTLLVPALKYTRQDDNRDELTEGDIEYLIGSIREILAALLQANKTRPKEPVEETQPDYQVRICGCAAGDELDELSLELLQAILDPARWSLEIMPYETLTS
jgi:predicted PurR-regulated permease PerM